MSRLGSSLNVKSRTAVALASCHLQQDLDRRLEQLTEGRSLLGPKVNCANGTPTSLFCPPSQQGRCCGRCPRALLLLSKGAAAGGVPGPSTCYLSSAGCTCSQNPRVRLSSPGPWPGVCGLLGQGCVPGNPSITQKGS